MPAEVVNSAFCADYWGVFEVPGSNGKTYEVELGGTSYVHCTCKAFEWAKMDNKDCKHIRYVWDNACLWNPQWHDAGPRNIKPVRLTETRLLKDPCPGCGGPTVPVRIAV